jgi:hypothetical protein
MAAPKTTSALWIRGLLSAGGLLAVALLAQTVLNYRFVSTSLIRQEARRMAEDRARSIERTIRLSRPENADSLRAVLDDLRGETPDQIASIAVLRGDGTVVAGVGPTTSTLALIERPRLVRERDSPLLSDKRDDRDVLVGVFPCRCSFPPQAPGGGGQPAVSRLFLEIAVYPEALSASFARLRRNATISATAAFALFISVSLIAVRFGRYVRGKQLDAQMDVARQVQRDLLPSADGWPPGVDLAVHCTPAWQVGGDFYDVVNLPGGGVAFAVGDVSGHGISAALLMGLIYGAMSSPPWGVAENEPERAAGRLNQLLLDKSSGDRYASLFWCAYDPTVGVLRYINGGHPPPVWIRCRPDGTRELNRLTQGGPVLGLLNSASYRVTSVQMGQGDLLVLFSDGIVEATNARDEQFGEERLIAIAEELAQAQAHAIGDAIITALRAFNDAKPAQDDQTLLVIRLWRADSASTAASRGSIA